MGGEGVGIGRFYATNRVDVGFDPRNPASVSANYMRLFYPTSLYTSIGVGGEAVHDTFDNDGRFIGAGPRVEASFYPLGGYRSKYLSGLFISLSSGMNFGAQLPDDNPTASFATHFMSGISIGLRPRWPNGLGVGAYFAVNSHNFPTDQRHNPALVTGAQIQFGSPPPVNYIEQQVDRTKWMQISAMDAVTSPVGDLMLKGKVEGWGPKQLARNKHFATVLFSLKKADGTLIELGRTKTDTNGWAVLRVSADNMVYFESGNSKHEVEMEVLTAWGKKKIDTAVVRVVDTRPALLVDIQTVINEIEDEDGWRHYEIVPDAAESIKKLEDRGYRIIYAAPRMNISEKSSVLKTMAEGNVPRGPVFFNRIGIDSWDGKINLLSLKRDHLFWDDTISRTRAFAKVPLVAAIVRNDKRQLHEKVAHAHHLDVKTVQADWPRVSDYFLDRYTPLSQTKVREFVRRRTEQDLAWQLDQLTLTRAHPNNCVELITDGRASFAQLKDLLKKSEWAVVEAFQWKSDKKHEVSKELTAILVKMARDGKRVRVMVDGAGSMWLILRSMPKRFRDIAAAGSKARVSRFGTPFAEPIDILHRFLIRDHRKVFLGKVIDPEDPSKNYIWVILGGRNIGDRYWGRSHDAKHPNKYDNSIVIIGNSIQDIYRELARVASLTKVSSQLVVKSAPFTLEEQDEFRPTGDLSCHKDTATPIDDAKGVPVRYVSHYPTEDNNIYRAFLAMLRNPHSQEFMFESAFPVKIDIMRELIAEKRRHPNKRIVWITGSGGFIRMHDKECAILMSEGIEVIMRAPEKDPTTHKIDPFSTMHVKTFSDGERLFVGTWNPDVQTERDLESGVIVRNQALINKGIRYDRNHGIEFKEWIEVKLRELATDPNDRGKANRRIKRWKKTMARLEYPDGLKTLWHEIANRDVLHEVH